ncbi:MAG: 23S rRNA (pseudouridine(1915)-N(3))-methyltransferase RlmH [Gammaproteobacteria bacterium]|nr:23S rRNA (pseudouridine(1915)-N(3))-methyltransferase RlmH [Gammaproteobacteria bacterium]
MKIHLLSVGNKMPPWITKGYQEYARRLSGDCSLNLIEIPPGHRGKNADVARILRDEGERTLKAIPKGCLVLALDVKGKPWSTEQLSDRMGEWLGDGRNLALLIGGPEGLAESCLQRAEGRWSLSPLTFPHPLVRVIIAEQLYRAWSLLHNHPYHRA